MQEAWDRDPEGSSMNKKECVKILDFKTLVITRENSTGSVTIRYTSFRNINSSSMSPYSFPVLPVIEC
jgi:hypothetical protein